MAGVTLQGATKDNDSPVLFRPPTRPEDPRGGVLVANDGAGALLEFDAADGAYLRAVPLQAFGGEDGEADFPNYVRFSVAQIDAARFVYLTYAAGQVWAWDEEGERVGGVRLAGAPQDESACHSFSFADGRAWLRDSTSGVWRGYRLKFAAAAPTHAAAQQPAVPAYSDTRSAEAAGASEQPSLAAASQADAEVCPIATE